METKYSSEFKADALRLAEAESPKTASEKLGLQVKHIYNWRRAERLKQAKSTKTTKTGESLAETNKRLEKENEELREANHILKKAMGFFVGR